MTVTRQRRRQLSPGMIVTPTWDSGEYDDDKATTIKTNEDGCGHDPVFEEETTKTLDNFLQYFRIPVDFL